MNSDQNTTKKTAENKTDRNHLEPTDILDSDHPDIIDYTSKILHIVGDDPVDKAVVLYYAVRDGIRYDPYYPFYKPEHYRGSNVLKSKRGYCVCKASLLCTLARAAGIPSRIGFADVKNHLATRQLIAFLGSDLFVFHGYVEFYINGKWIIATPAFNRELCERHNVIPLEFDGRNDSIFQAYNLKQKKYMEYIRYHGTFSDIPVDIIVDAWKKEYGKDRVGQWIDAFEKAQGRDVRDFYTEEIL